MTPPKAVKEPERVWLVQFPIHPGLVFQANPDHVVMYEYGEWDWFALQRTHWTRVFPVFLWPTQGSLSRRVINLPVPVGHNHSSETIRRAFMADKAWAIDADHKRVRQLLAQLEQRYGDSSEQPLYRPDLDTYFVKDRVSYHALRTCQEVMVAWLRQLDCRVSGLLWTWKWEVSSSPDFSQLMANAAAGSAGK